jgi:pimeloyl-ACP methyl ester carboxylesterase
LNDFGPRIHGDETSIDGGSSSRTPINGVVMMLHGWAQNVHVFSNRAKKLTKRLNLAGYRVLFLQAPHRLPPKKILADPRHSNSNKESHSEFSREFAYAWFYYNADDPASDSTPVPSSTGNYPGMDQSLQFLHHELQTLSASPGITTSIPPIFLLGFSQGAVLVHKIASLTCREAGIATVNPEADGNKSLSFSRTTFNNDNSWCIIRKCILVSGFPFSSKTTVTDRVHHNTLDDTSGDSSTEIKNTSTSIKRIIPSFHVLGRQDQRVPNSLSRQIYLNETCFAGKAIVWEHDRGHVLPQDYPFCQRLIEFLQS